jgi:hypothetical protein
LFLELTKKVPDEKRNTALQYLHGQLRPRLRCKYQTTLKCGGQTRLPGRPSPLQIRRRRMARHRRRERHLRRSLQLIIRRALRWHCGRRQGWRQGRRHWRGWLGVSPRRQPPLHPRRAHNGLSRLHPLLMARPEYALPLPPQSIRREHRTSHVQTDTEHNVFHSIPSSAARALFTQPAPAIGTGHVRGLRPRVIALHRATPPYPGTLGLNRK